MRTDFSAASRYLQRRWFVVWAAVRVLVPPEGQPYTVAAAASGCYTDDPYDRGPVGGCQARAPRQRGLIRHDNGYGAKAGGHYSGALGQGGAGAASGPASLSRGCHNSPQRRRAEVDVHGRVFAGQGDSWTSVDSCKRPESTSQVEYAGSIPVIGSTSTSGNAVRTVRLGGVGGLDSWTRQEHWLPGLYLDECGLYVFDGEMDGEDFLVA